MNTFEILNTFKITCSSLCDNCSLEYHTFNTYNDLQVLLKEYKYINGSEYFDALIKGSKIPEEVQALKNKVIALADDHLLNYNDVTFVIKKHCYNHSVINNLCKECFESIHKLDPDQIINILLYSEPKDIYYDLPVAKKIQNILQKSDKCLDYKQIYDLGAPWNTNSKTPINNIRGRCSTMHKQGIIKYDPRKKGYYV